MTNLEVVATDESAHGAPEGWICLHRRLLHSIVFTDAELLRLWVWCLLKASHRERWVPYSSGKGNRPVKLVPGQFIYGRNSAAESLNTPATTTDARMQKLVLLGCIVMQRDKQYSIVTICNWQSYQQVGGKVSHATGKQPTCNRQATGTDNNENNSNNENKFLVAEPADALFEAWNGTPGVVKARSMTPKRRVSARARLADQSWDWKAALAKFPLSCFSDQPGEWTPNLDWFLRPDTVTKILEGDYDWSKPNGRPQPASPARILSGEYSDPARYASTPASS